MRLSLQKKLAAKAFKVSPKRVKLDPKRGEDIKEGITKSDMRGLFSDGAISVLQKKGVSRARANKILKQKAKGRRKGVGSRKGKKTAISPKKDTWMNKIRSQRKLLRSFKEGGLVDTKTFRDLYNKAKGGFFRSRKHIKLYVQEHRLFKQK